jgi:hypothetical protein
MTCGTDAPPFLRNLIAVRLGSPDFPAMMAIHAMRQLEIKGKSKMNDHSLEVAEV